MPGAPTTKFSLPSPGDINAQIQAGESILQALQAGDLNTLQQAGIQGLQESKKAGGIIGVISGAVGSGASTAATIASGATAIGAIDGSLAGVSAAGPYAAAVAAVIAVVVSLVGGLEESYSGVKYIFPLPAGNGPPDNPSQTNAHWIASWRPNNQPAATAGYTLSRFGNPIGFELAQYLAKAFPPGSTKRPNLALYLMQQVAAEVWREGVPASDALAGGDTISIYLDASCPLGASGAFSAQGLPTLGIPAAGYGAEWGAPAFKGPMSPSDYVRSGIGGTVLAAPVFWHWFDWQNINPGQTDPSQQTYPFNLYYSTVGGPGRSGNLISALQTDPVSGYGGLEQAAQQAVLPLPTTGGKTLSAHEVFVRAVQRAPDPLFFAAALYGCAPGGNFTILYNVDLANAMATVMLMLSTGASTRSIVSELLVQASILREKGALGYTNGDPRNVSPGFQALLDDYLALSHAEDHERGAATMASVIARYPDGWMGRGPAKAVAALTPGSPGPVVVKKAGESKAQAAAVIAGFVHLYLHI